MLVKKKKRHRCKELLAHKKTHRSTAKAYQFNSGKIKFTKGLTHNATILMKQCMGHDDAKDLMKRIVKYNNEQVNKNPPGKPIKGLVIWARDFNGHNFAGNSVKDKGWVRLKLKIDKSGKY